MPLSRHFYSLDEVQALLFHTNEIFWCQELLVSGCISEAISVLFQSWLWNTCSIEWLLDAWKTLSLDQVDENDILVSTYQLSTLKRDNSLWNILISTIQHPNKMPDTVTRKTPAFVGGDKEMYFMRAMFQGKAQCAFWMSQFIDAWPLLRTFAQTSEHTLCLDALQHYDKLLGYNSEEYDIITRCAAICMLIIPSKPLKTVKIEKITDVGRISNRTHSIRNEYLYGITLRGTRTWSKSNRIQLDTIEKYLPGCPFWEEAAEVATTMYKEDFYDIYFPDGTPDTWSVKEKEKSHGGGVLGPDEKISIWKYSRNFMSHISRFAWNTHILDYLKGLDIEYEDGIDCFPMSIMKLYVKPIWKDVCLKPVRKIRTI